MHLPLVAGDRLPSTHRNIFWRTRWANISWVGFLAYRWSFWWASTCSCTFSEAHLTSHRSGDFWVSFMSITISSMIDSPRQQAALQPRNTAPNHLQAHSSLESRARPQTHTSLDKT